MRHSFSLIFLDDILYPQDIDIYRVKNDSYKIHFVPYCLLTILFMFILHSLKQACAHEFCTLGNSLF